MAGERQTQIASGARAGVISLLCLAVFAAATAQIAKRRPVSKGPRALAVIELAANGRTRLVPVTIMLEGKFYDAGVYKADPVPMALQFETVYEGFKSGVSQGLFTVGGAGQNDGAWFADGTWQTTAQIEAEKAKHQDEVEKKGRKPPADEELGGPPKLRHATGTSGSAPSASAPPAPKPAPEPKAGSSPAPKPSTAPAASPGYDSVESPDRPTLRRQPVSETAHEQTKTSPETAPLQSAPLQGALQLIPAISDADGPEPRPYTYQLKPEEEQDFRKKMLAFAADEVNRRASLLAAQVEQPKAAGKKARPSPAPQFQDVQMHAFDVSNTNEAVIVLTAGAILPSAPGNIEYLTAVVARQDIYGDLHKIFAATTDNKHLDVLPKYELIDAVDADGDGRGELLFRETGDSGTAFAVYRVLGDRLWPLFEGKPGT